MWNKKIAIIFNFDIILKNSLEDHHFKIYVFRNPFIQTEPLIETAFQLEGKTIYRRPALREEAPLVTDCLTSIHYIFKKALGIDIPVTFIGDMPRQLFALSEWRLLKIDIKEAQCGDILFVRNKMNPKLLSHAALIVEVNKIFHCYPGRGTAVFQSQGEFFDAYEQKLDFKRMISYIDPRNKDLREAHEGSFLS